MTLNSLTDSPIIAFTILLTVIFTIPPIFEKLRLPGLVGLLVAGVVLGQNGLKLLDSESDTIKLLSDIGKIYLMFVAGLEIDLEQFRKTKNRSIGFGFSDIYSTNDLLVLLQGFYSILVGMLLF